MALSNPPFKKAGSFEALLLAVIFILIFAMAARTPLDSDLWWHLRSGQENSLSGHPLLTDVFSFTRYGSPWINHSWLSQVLFYWAFLKGGFFALGGLIAGLAVLSMALVYLQLDGALLMKVAGLLLGSIVASTVWGARPQLFSLVLMALVGYLLYLLKWRAKDRLWLLPIIFAVWSNLHGGYALGFLWIGFFLAGEGVNHLFKLQSGPLLPGRKIARLVFWSVLAALAVLINPNGIDMWKIPFQTVNVGALQQFIPEWASPNFHVLLQQSFLWLFFAIFASVALSQQGMDGVDLVSVLGFGYMSLLAQRNFGPFALAAVPVLVRYGSRAVDQWQSRSPWPAWAVQLWTGKSSSPAGRLKVVLDLAVVCLLLLAAFAKLYIVTQPALVDTFIQQQYPAQAVRWLEQNHPQGSVLNEYNWGGFLAWNLPRIQVFVDGRTDLFGDEVIGEWMTAVEGDDGWEKVLENNKVDLVMIAPWRGLNEKLSHSDWKLLYQDPQVVIYGSPVIH